MTFRSNLVAVFLSTLAMSTSSWAADCNKNGVDDLEDIKSGTSSDCDGNFVPDECDAETAPGSAFWADCNTNGSFDLCDLDNGSSADCDENLIPDECDVQDLNIVVNTLPSIYSGNDVRKLTVGDWDGDADDDLAAGDALDGGIRVLINQSGGSSWSETAPELPAGQQTLALTSADFNGDTIEDLVGADVVTSTVYVYFGVGDGTFLFAQQSAVGNGPQAIAAADLNSDGAPDLVVGQSDSESDTLSLLINDSQGEFPPVATQIDGANVNVQAIRIDDLDNDGDQDLALACNVFGAQAPNLTLMFNDGLGNFSADSKRDFAVGIDVLFDLAVTDIDLDGDSDVIVPNADGSLFIVRREADGDYLVISTGHVFVFLRGIATLHLDGDALPDIAVTDYSTGAVQLLRNLGDGTFAGPLGVDTSLCPWGIATADFDRDGDADLATADGCASGAVDVILNSTDGGAADCDENNAPDTCVLGEQVASLWIGGVSNWNDPENWCPNLVPDNTLESSFDVTVDGPQGNIMLDLAPITNTVSLLNGAGLEVNRDNGSLSRTLTAVTSITNSGLIAALDGRELVIQSPEIQQGVDGALQAAIGEGSEDEQSILVIFGGSVIGGSACGLDSQSRIHLVDGAELSEVSVCGLRVPSGQSGGFRDNLYNTGNIEIGDGEGSAAFIPGVGGGTLIASRDISATLTLNSTPTSLSEMGHYFYSVTNGVSHSILGGGLIWGPFINDGQVQATDPDAPLIISSPGTKTSNGILSANGGELIIADDVEGEGLITAIDGNITIVPEDESLVISGGSLNVGSGGSADIEAGAEVVLGGEVVMSCGSGARGCTPPVISSGGGSKLEADGDLQMEGDGSLIVEEGAVWKLHGNFNNQSTDNQGFDWQGALVMEGGTEFGPLTIDAAGENRGPNAAGFLSNFSIGIFEIAAATSVLVVDNFDNQEDGSTECDESVYVDTLILNDGSNLATNGCKFYYNELVDLGGSIDKNVISVEPGPPICLGDANGDEIVDPLDSGYVMSRFDCEVGAGDAECDAADVNHDGQVDFLDTGYILSRFGPCWE